MSSRVLTRPDGDEIAAVYGEGYFTKAKTKQIKVGEKLDILCSDGLNYHVEVKELKNGEAKLHFRQWSTSYDYHGKLDILYLAPIGHFSEGITLSTNTYPRDNKDEPPVKAKTAAQNRSKAAAQSQSNYAANTRYSDELLKPRLSYGSRRDRSGNNTSISSHNDSNLAGKPPRDDDGDDSDEESSEVAAAAAAGVYPRSKKNQEHHHHHRNSHASDAAAIATGTHNHNHHSHHDGSGDGGGNRRGSSSSSKSKKRSKREEEEEEDEHSSSPAKKKTTPSAVAASASASSGSNEKKHTSSPPSERKHTSSPPSEKKRTSPPSKIASARCSPIANRLLPPSTLPASTSASTPKKTHGVSQEPIIPTSSVASPGSTAAAITTAGDEVLTGGPGSVQATYPIPAGGGTNQSLSLPPSLRNNMQGVAVAAADITRGGHNSATSSNTTHHSSSAGGVAGAVTAIAFNGLSSQPPQLQPLLPLSLSMASLYTEAVTTHAGAAAGGGGGDPFVGGAAVTTPNELLRDILKIDKAIETSRRAIELVSSYPRGHVLPQPPLPAAAATSDTNYNIFRQVLGPEQLLDLLHARQGVEEAIKLLITPPNS